MFKNQDVLDLLSKMTENKEDFVQMLESVENHDETMKILSQCYELGDLSKLQSLIKEIIEKHNKRTQAKKTVRLANGAGAATETSSAGPPTVKGAFGGLNIFNYLVLPSLTDLK